MIKEFQNDEIDIKEAGNINLSIEEEYFFQIEIKKILISRILTVI